MKFQRSTLILLFLALGLAGSVYYYETQVVPQKELALEKERQLFSFPAKQVVALTIKQEKQNLEFERVAVKPGNAVNSSPWQMVAPINTPASDPAVSFLLNLLANSKSKSTLMVLPDRLHEYGLDRPVTVIKIKLKDRQSHQLILGQTNFDSSSLYALVDPPDTFAGEIEVFLVPLDFQNAVDRSLSEWQSENKLKTK
jgi:hypothetical protein